jgi:hypothetical protein
MFAIPRVLSIASAAALTLALSQGVVRAEQPAAPAPAAPPAPVTQTPAATPAPSAMDAARAKFEARRAELDAERVKRYEELRARAAEIGVDLPETPPWAGANLPRMPEMPPQGAGMTAEEMNAMRAQREAMREKMQKMTPEERKAAREAHWQEMRARAAERGIEMPESPPWVEAEQRYKAAQEQFDKYRKTIDELTPEQVEAARAVFGRGGPAMPGMNGPMPPMGPRGQMPQGGYGYGPQGGYPGYGGYPEGPVPMTPPVMPDVGGDLEQAPPPPQGY